MKKTLATIAIALVLTTSIIAGTLAMYTTAIDKLAEGSVVAKEFILTEGGTDTFVQNVKLSPSESGNWQFSVKNFSGSLVSETAMALDFNVTVRGADGKTAIAPLVITVSDENGRTVGTVTGSGSIQFDDEFALSASGQEKVYTVNLSWPSNNSVDINYAGGSFGTEVEVSVTGTQK